MAPILSVIVPIYNCEKYINQCVDSILSQTLKNFEIILIDDGSTDGSIAICDDYAKKDDRIRVFHKQNGGVSSARNLGIKKASGDWITFIDSDDWVENNWLECVLFYANHYNCNMIMYGYCSIFNNGTKIISIPNYDGIIDISNIDHIKMLYHQMWNYCVRSNVIHNNNIRFSIDVNYAEDTEFMNECALKSQSLYSINSSLYNHNKSNYDSLTSLISKKRALDHLIVAYRILIRYQDSKLSIYTSASLIIRFITIVIQFSHKNIFSDYVFIHKNIKEIIRIIKLKYSFFDKRMKLKIKYPSLYYLYMLITIHKQ